MAKQTKITIETESLLILRGRTTNRAWCPACAAEREVIALEDIGVISNLERSALEEWLNSGNLHRSADSQWLDPDLPELSHRSSAEDKKHLTTTFTSSNRQKGDNMKSRSLRTISIAGLFATLALTADHSRSEPKGQNPTTPSPISACWATETTAQAST